MYYRDPPAECVACDGQGSGLCQACSEGLAQATAYLLLGRSLGLELRP